MGEKKSKSIIRNTKRSDSSSKLIFGDDILSSQLFLDYGDMEILRYVQPEVIEDVLECYVPLFGMECESDTVKKVNITKHLYLGENKFNLPLYIIFLDKYKTQVEYNVDVQRL